MTKNKTVGFTSEPRNEDQGNYLPHLGRYVRVTFPSSTFYGKMIRTNYDITVLSPTLNIVSNPYNSKKVICAERTDEPTTLDTKQISGVSFLGEKAFNRFLEEIAKGLDKHQNK